VGTEPSLGVQIQRIRDRLRRMRTEREAAMEKLATSREHADAQRQVLSDVRVPSQAPPDGPTILAP
jgi:hypothetical protein